jgi:hypothetical protein
MSKYAGEEAFVVEHALQGIGMFGGVKISIGVNCFDFMAGE